MREVDPDEARRLMAEGATLLDVREVGEWRAGHAPGAVHAPLSALDSADAPRGRSLVIICRSGRRSSLAQRQLIAAGREAINVAGGMLAWREAGLPVITDDGAPGDIA